MIAEYLTRRDAENYARELARHYGPDVHFDVVGMPDPVFGDAVWYVRQNGAQHFGVQESGLSKAIKCVRAGQPRAVQLLPERPRE